MCSAECTKPSWQDAVVSGLTLMYSAARSILWAQGSRGHTGGLQTHCEVVLNWSEQTELEPPLRYQAKHVESPVVLHTEDPRRCSRCSPEAPWVFSSPVQAARLVPVRIHCSTVYDYRLYEFLTGNPCWIFHRLHFAYIQLLFKIDFSL